VAVGCATAILTIGQAWLLSRSLGDVFETQTMTVVWAVLPWLAAVFGGKALLGWLNTWLAQRAAADVKSQLRRDIMTARLTRPTSSRTSTGGLIALLTKGLDGLDGYYAKYLPQLALAVTVPVILGVAVVATDFTSAFIMVVTLPLIPVFMALIGWATEARTKKRWRVQTRLANHFMDLITGLPTLQVFGRARAQSKGLRRTEARHRRETMGTLRVSFLSSLALELLATLSVAIVAVAIGFRVVYGQMDLSTAFFVLILAPEVYLPVRMVGVHYHDSADGIAAADAAFAEIDGVAGDAAGTGAAPSPATGTVRFTGVGYTYPGAEEAAVAGLDLSVPPGDIVALAGRSGTGKTTVVNLLLGFLVPTRGSVTVGDTDLRTVDRRRWLERVAYVPQSPGMVRGTVADNVALGDPAAARDVLRDALDAAGAADIALDQPVSDDGEGLSAGERRRIAMARAILRIQGGGAEFLVLDEPTAGLDTTAERRLLATVRGLGVGALIVSHRPQVLADADSVVDLDPTAVAGRRDERTGEVVS
jgi:thiol reductant ABC exporter CydD subunit